MKWEELPMADRAKLMAAAVRNGYTDIRSIKAAYANYLNEKLSTGNRYAKGGDTDEPEVINMLDTLPVWKALEKIDYTAIPDSEFTREKTGAGSIEYFSAEEPEGVTYNNGYHRDHPMPGHDVILYNPNTNDEQDIRLDALHIMPKDPTYDALNSLYRAKSLDALDDNYYNAWINWRADRGAQTLNNTVERALYGPEANEYVGVDSFEQYFNNEADGTLRSILMEGDENYREAKNYYGNKDEVKQWNAHLMPYINRIEQYLRTGERPADVLPELVVTNQNANGGNLFTKGGNKKKKSQPVPWSYIETELRKRGVTNPVHLAALRANMEVESGRIPDNVNPYSGAKGLMQWLGARKPKSWDLGSQLDYIAATYNKFGGNEWLNKQAWKRFNETNDPKEAARLFRRYWERPEASSWYATDKYFGKGSKQSYLPQDVNDLVSQVSELSYADQPVPTFTEEDQRLLDTPALASYTPDYLNFDISAFTNQPSVKQDRRSPAEAWALFNSLFSTPTQETYNPFDWYAAMLSPNKNINAYGGNLFDKGGIKKDKPKYSVGGVQGFLNLLDKKGIKYTKTSDFRKGAMTKSGHPSWHSKKDLWGNSMAADIWFTNFDKAKKAIYSDPELVAYLVDNKLGILEETTDAVKRKTGAKLGPNRGNHFHIGPDRWAVSMRDNAIRQFGVTYHPMQDVTWEDVQAKRQADKQRYELTPEEEVLLNTSALATYNPEYTDNLNPAYTSPLMEAVRLNPEYDEPTNNLANLAAFYALQQNSSQPSDNSDWFSTMLTLKPRVAPEQTETEYQLFTPLDGDFMYHGLNFAAYGGKINDNHANGGYLFKKEKGGHLFPLGGYANAIKAINSTGEGFHYVINGQKLNKQQAIDYINKHKNEHYVVNRYSTTASTAGKQNEEQNWQILGDDGRWVDNNEYYPSEGNLDEVVVTAPYNTRKMYNEIQQDRTYLQHNPIIDINVPEPIDFTNTEQNMFHRRDVARGDAQVREALSSDVTDNIYDYMMPSTWAGTIDKLLDHDENGNLKYNFFTDFNKVFNPTYDNQGFVGLAGFDRWAEEHPEETSAINLTADMLFPYGIKGTKAVATSSPIMNYRLARSLDKALGPSIKLTERIIPGKLSPYESAVAKYSNSVNIPTGRMNWLDRLYYDALKNNDARTIKTLTEYQYATRNGILPTRVYHGSPKTDIHQFAGRKVLNSGYSDGTFLFPEEFSQNANYYISKFGRRDGKVYPLFMPMDKFKEIIEFDGLGRLWNAIPEKIAADAFGMTTKELHDAIGRYGGPGLRNYSVNQLARLGSDMEKDMVIANNIKDAGPIMNQTQYMLMKPQTLKLLNPVTFDDTGNIIPLSLRFNLDIYDTRYAEGGNLFRKGGKKNNPISVGGVTAGSQANTEQCAKYSNNYLRGHGYIANGNAWNQGGGSVVFSGYDGLERPAVFDKEAVEAYNSAASDNVWNNFDSNTLDKDSVYTVNMYYKGSPYLEEAYKNGTKGRTGTHTGYLKYENGDWYVVHNIHGKVHVDKFTSIQGGNRKYGVTGIYVPRTNNIFNRAITKLGFADGGYLFNSEEQSNNK